MPSFEIYAYKDSELFGSEMPETDIDLIQIRNFGIKVIISLDEDIQEHPNYNTIKDEFELHEIFVTDFEIPRIEQIEQTLNIISKAIEENKPVLVHCLAGCGRTGVMLALTERFIYGTEDGEKAIRMVREIRPCAVETQKQYDFVVNYKRS
jgi:protein-tyrosine phosphatase